MAFQMILGIFGAFSLMASAMAGISTYSSVSPQTHLFNGAPIQTPFSVITYISQISVYTAYQRQQEFENHFHHRQPFQSLTLYNTFGTSTSASYYAAPQQLFLMAVRPANLAKTAMIYAQVWKKPQEMAIAERAALAVATLTAHVDDLNPSSGYDFSNGVHDSITGDMRGQVESRIGDSVYGAYSLLDADGFKSTVTYTADDLNGFEAERKREPVDEHFDFDFLPLLHVPLQHNSQHVPELTVQQQAENQQQKLSDGHDHKLRPHLSQTEQHENHQDQEKKKDETEPKQQGQELGEVLLPSNDDSDVIEAPVKTNKEQSMISTTTASGL